MDINKQYSIVRLQDVLKRSLLLEKDKYVGKRHWVYDVLKTSDIHCLEDVQFMTSWLRLIYDVLKTSDLHHFETSNLGRLKKVWFITSPGRLVYDVLKTCNLRWLEGVWFMTSWRPLIYNVLKKSVKRRPCNNIVATSIKRQRKLFFLILCCLKYSDNFKFSSLG